jgi:hypothetical protein
MIPFILVGFLSILLGILYVGYLTTHPLKMSPFLAGSVLTLVLIVAVIGARFSGNQVWLAAGLALAGFILGYLGMAKVVLSRDDSRPVPALTRKPEDPGLGTPRWCTSPTASRKPLILSAGLINFANLMNKKFPSCPSLPARFSSMPCARNTWQ